MTGEEALRPLAALCPGMKIIYSGMTGDLDSLMAQSRGFGMTRRTTVTREDDLDGSPAQETLRFGIDGPLYEIDLSKKNAARFRQQLAPFIEHARKAATGSRRPARTAASRQRSRDIRAWAQEQGIPLSGRGRIPADIYAQYDAARGKSASRRK